MLKLYWIDFRKNILFIITGILVIFLPKFIQFPHISNDINDVLFLCEGKSVSEVQTIIDEYIDEVLAEIKQSNLSYDEKTSRLNHISFLYTRLTESLNDKATVEELIENAKTDCGLALSLPPKYYYDNIDEYKNISYPINVVNDSSWKIFTTLQRQQLISITVLCIIAAIWGKNSEHRLYRYEQISLLGKCLNRLRIIISFGVCIAVWMLSYITDIVACKIAIIPDTAIQSVKDFMFSPLCISVTEYLIILGVLELMGLIIAFSLFYHLNSVMRDIKKTLLISALVVLLSYILKNGYGDVFSWIMFGICDYNKFFDGSLYNSERLIIVFSLNVLIIFLIVITKKSEHFIIIAKKQIYK